jgi:hypothetical protein
MTSFAMPPRAVAAIDELAALLELDDRHEIHKTPDGPGVALAAIMWMRANEAGAALLRQLAPQDHEGTWPLPRVPLFLTARWLFEGSLIARWVAQDPAERAPRVLAHAAREQRGLLAAYGLEVPAATIATAKGLPPVRDMANAIGPPGEYKVYESLCEPMHWGGLWLAESVEDREDGYWLTHLAIVPTSLREILGATGAICGIDVAGELARVPSCLFGRDRLSGR